MSRLFPELEGVVAPAPTPTATPLAPGRAPAPNAMPTASASRSDGASAPSAATRAGNPAPQQHGMTPNDEGRPSIQSGSGRASSAASLR